MKFVHHWTLVLLMSTSATHAGNDHFVEVMPEEFEQVLSEQLTAAEQTGAARMHDSLRRILADELSGQVTTPLSSHRNEQGIRLDQQLQMKQSRIVIDVTLEPGTHDTVELLESFDGIEVLGVVHTPSYTLVSLASDALGLLSLAQLPGLKSAHPVYSQNGRVSGFDQEHQRRTDAPHQPNSQGAANNQAETALEVDAVRRVFTNLNGSGISVGTLSDSVNQVGGGIAASQATNDLPGNTIVTVLADSGSSPTDEGRAMMELIHDMTPNLSSLSFATAVGGEATFANNITALANAGMDIINDDYVYFAEPYYQDGVVAQAVTSYVNQGGLYFALNHNFANLSYEGIYNDTSGNGRHNFGVNDSFMQITLAGNARLLIGLQWAQPWGNASTDLDLELWNSSFTATLATSTTANVGGNPFEFIDYTNPGNTAITASIAVPAITGNTSNLTLKFILFDNGANRVTIDQFTNGAAGTLTPHAATPQSIAIGAAPFFDRNTAEPFSGIGPHRRFFNTAGNPVGPFTLTKPDFTSIDNVNTTFFGVDIPQDTDSLPNFSGTSAATPNAAAVSALMLQAAGGPGSLTQAEIKEILTMSAIDLGPQGYDLTYGNGRIHALGATALARGGQAPETTIYLNQFGDSFSDRDLFAPNDVDSFIFSSNTAGSTQIDITEIDGEMDPMVAVFVPDFSQRVGVDYDGGPDLDDARITYNNSNAFPYLAEVLTETDFSGNADFTIFVDGPDQQVSNRTGNLNANNDDLGINGSLFTRGDSNYFEYTSPVDGQLFIDLAPSGFTGLIRFFNDQGTFLEGTSVGSGSSGRLTVNSVDQGENYVIQIVPQNYIGSGSYQLDVDFEQGQVELTVIKSGSGMGTVVSDGIAGINCGNDCSEFYDLDTTVALQASPIAGHSFVGWTGSCIPAGDRCVVTMSSPRTITAIFAGPDDLFEDGFE